MSQRRNGRSEGSTLRPIRYRRISQTWGCYPILWADGRRDNAEAVCRQSLAMRQALVKEQSEVSWNRELLARSQSHLAFMLDATGRAVESETTYREMIATLASLVADFPDVPQ